MADRTLTAACHCQSIRFTITIPASVLPLKVHICHCSVCRYTHGTPCSFHAPLPAGVAPQFIAPSRIDKLTPYNHAESLGTRHFCSTCGCHIGDRSHGDGSWVISTAIFTEPNQGLWEMRSHAFTKSSLDGGLSAMFSHIDGRQLKFFNPEPLLDAGKAGDHGRINTVQNEEKLHAECHCGGVSFSIARPRKEFLASPASEGWVLPRDTSKWLALLDLCDDCRLVDGTNVIAWMFVPVDHLSPSPPADLIIGSSKSYKSSEEVLRTFCGTCGATVFYSCTDRPGMVDVAVGILHAPEGVMIENWALWRGRISSAEDGKYDPGFSKALIEGLKVWGSRRDMPKDFVLPRN
ncbi:hypothetical protein N7491_002321 [Penicillium cf. griseofulvum]|uniref:CENP-V/GFA domain-containing protein n=1 Tax=Penicillium cf. griseofulvum TaxID=2972120 RepID=A0A9W9T2H8_9EURO|nr:hypothetical protein N7472_003496 [Penicillium cf. griseofulvum]KAJ5446239.1 hypothetical protein N7491_002321 [Penicillium cf. griseofulvum]KAJ5447980.1 hypothetical protein N7445_002801 [Penicillium cf. griseofulvum]